MSIQFRRSKFVKANIAKEGVKGKKARAIVRERKKKIGSAQIKNFRKSYDEISDGIMKTRHGVKQIGKTKGRLTESERKTKSFLDYRTALAWWNDREGSVGKRCVPSKNSLGSKEIDFIRGKDIVKKILDEEKEQRAKERAKEREKAKKEKAKKVKAKKAKAKKAKAKKAKEKTKRKTKPKKGKIKVGSGKNRSLFSPIEEDCTCPTCQKFTLAYLHHLFKAKELTALTLSSIHNLHFMVDLMARYREQILADAI